MKVEELRAKDIDALKAELESLRKAQFNYRMQQATGQLGQSHLMRETRRDIARIKTLINEKKSEAAS